MQLTPNPYDLKLKLVCRENIDRLSEFLKTGSCFPMAIEVSPTNRCNLNCSWCISKQYHRNEDLDRDTLLRFIKEYREMGGKSLNWSGGGEPTIYPHFAEAVYATKDAGIDQGLMTNGLCESDALLAAGRTMHWIRVSLDTVNRDRYKELKGVDALQGVLDSIQFWATQPAKLIVNMNIAESNADEVLAVATTAKMLGADAFQIRPVLPIPSDPTCYIPLHLNDMIDDLKSLNGDGFFCHVSYDKFNDINKPREYKSCLYHNFLCVLNSNGDLSVCMYRLYEDDFTFGNIYRNSLDDIWDSDRRWDVVEKCTNMDFSQCQVCCKGHELNTFLHYLELADRMSDRKFL